MLFGLLWCPYIVFQFFFVWLHVLNYIRTVETTYLGNTRDQIEVS